jgi:tRNA dimethylallyltransferase
MDIGTVKPSQRDLRDVRHHLINLLLPQESFSAGMFKKIAVEVIDKLHKKEKIPLVVGGTGLYIKTLTRGLFEGPEADWSFREGLMKKEKEQGKGYLHQYLKMVDQIAAEKINPNDRRRIIRALEVFIKGKQTISELQDLSTKAQDYHFVKIGLLRERKELYALIERRVNAMMERGLLKETERLLQMNPQRTSLQALGYKEMKLYLDGIMKIEDAVKLLKKRTKIYAKRQFTWFRKEPGIQWVDITGIMNTDKIFSTVVNNVEILKKLLYVKRKSKNSC